MNRAVSGGSITDIKSAFGCVMRYVCMADWMNELINKLINKLRGV